MGVCVYGQAVNEWSQVKSLKICHGCGLAGQ